MKRVAVVLGLGIILLYWLQGTRPASMKSAPGVEKRRAVTSVASPRARRGGDTSQFSIPSQGLSPLVSAENLGAGISGSHEQSRSSAWRTSPTAGLRSRIREAMEEIAELFRECVDLQPSQDKIAGNVELYVDIHFGNAGMGYPEVSDAIVTDGDISDDLLLCLQESAYALSIADGPVDGVVTVSWPIVLRR